MEITKKIYNKIIMSCPDTPIEIGGMIGSKSGVITEYISDRGSNEYGKYSPDTDMINKKIAVWAENGINFKGIYHSHYPNCDKLSQSDIEYIEKIMISVSDTYSFLYFPIVIPKKSITVYKAEIRNNKVFISKDELKLID